MRNELSKSTFIYFPKRLLLLFRSVFAFPKASSSGLDCRIFPSIPGSFLPNWSYKKNPRRNKKDSQKNVPINIFRKVVDYYTSPKYSKMVEQFHKGITLSKMLQNLISGLEHDHKTHQVFHWPNFLDLFNFTYRILGDLGKYYEDTIEIAWTKLNVIDKASKWASNLLRKMFPYGLSLKNIWTVGNILLINQINNQVLALDRRKIYMNFCKMIDRSFNTRKHLPRKHYTIIVFTSGFRQHQLRESNHSAN